MDQHAFGESLLEQARLEAVAGTGRVTETELLDRLRGDLPVLQLLAGPRADRRLELLLEIRRRDLVRLQQRLAHRRIAPAHRRDPSVGSGMDIPTFWASIRTAS